MPRLTIRTPKYRRHKASGQAVVTLAGRDIYLGRYGTPESKTEYNRSIAEWHNSSHQCQPKSASGGPTIDELILAYLEHARSYYLKHGRPTSTQNHIRDALGPLHDVYGSTPSAALGPLRIKTVRQRMIDERKWARTTVNKAVGIIKRMFKWGAENELVPAQVYQSLQAISGLRRGRCGAGLLKYVIETGPRQTQQRPGAFDRLVFEVEQVHRQALPLRQASDRAVELLDGALIGRYVSADISRSRDGVVLTLWVEPDVAVAVADPSAAPVAGDTAGNGHQPSPESLRPTKLWQAAMGPQKRLLDQVLGFLQVGGDVETDHVDQPHVLVVKLAVARHPAVEHGPDQFAVLLGLRHRRRPTRLCRPPSRSCGNFHNHRLSLRR